MGKDRIPLFAEEQVLATVQLEPALVILCLAALTWLTYKILLRNVSRERHHMFRNYFRNLIGHLVIGTMLFGLYEVIRATSEAFNVVSIVLPYLGLITIIWALIIIIRILRIGAFIVLFFQSMKAGVPLLLVNILTLLASIVMGGWFLSRFLEVNLMPLLATSAILSIVLGLALQDTLGNLFAAIALQIDKPFELGDWIEVKNGSEKIVGQVEEISWRSTLLLAITDELVTIPNRNLAQWQICNFSGRKRSFIRSHTFRIPYGEQLTTARQILLLVAADTPGVSRHPPPVVIITETTESWIALKVVYNIVDYGAQYGIADHFLTTALAALDEAGIRLATTRLLVEHKEASPRVQSVG